MWATSIGLTFSQIPLPGRAEVGDAGRDRYPRAREHDGALRLADQPREARRRTRLDCRHYLPWNFA